MYKRLKKRIGGYEKEAQLYRFTLDNRGKVFLARDLTDKFEYTESAKYGGYPGVLKSRLGKYISLLAWKRGQRRYMQIRDIIWVPKEKVIELSKARHIPFNKWGANSDKHFAWIHRDYMPFWLLGEYGGPLKDDAFIKQLQSNIKMTKQEIKTLKMGEKWNET